MSLSDPDHECFTIEITNVIRSRVTVYPDSFRAACQLDDDDEPAVEYARRMIREEPWDFLRLSGNAGEQDGKCELDIGVVLEELGDDYTFTDVPVPSEAREILEADHDSRIRKQQVSSGA